MYRCKPRDETPLYIAMRIGVIAHIAMTSIDACIDAHRYQCTSGYADHIDVNPDETHSSSHRDVHRCVH